MVMRLLPKTKLYPTLPHRDIIQRGDLSHWLQSELPVHRLVLISAPAGYGKTTLLSSLPEIFPEYRLAWLSLDADDNDVVRFIAGLGAALANIDSRLEKVSEDQIADLAGVVSGGAVVISLPQVVTLLVNTIIDLSLPDHILVLDDLHEITNPAIYEALDDLLEHLPLQTHVVISTRYEPQLHLNRLRARRQVTELHMSDLQFDLGESREFLSGLLELELSPACLNRLQEKTEGWPVGLVLLTSRLRNLRTPQEQTRFLEQLDRIDSLTFDYLADEILDQQPADLKKFLLKTSLLSELTPSLCQRMTGRADAGAVLETLYHRNLFLSLATGRSGSDEPIYRYHALFAEFLRLKLQRDDPGHLSKLHAQAAQAETEPGRVIHHLLAAEQWEAAAELIEQVGEQFLQEGFQETVANWVAALPEEVVSRRYRLLYVQGVSRLIKGDLEGARASLEKSLLDLKPDQDTIMGGKILTGLASLSFIRAEFSRCSDFVSQAEPYVIGLQEQLNFLMLRSSLALFYYSDWPRAESDFKKAVALVQESGDARLWFLFSIYLGHEFTVLPGVLDLLEEFCKSARLRYGTKVVPLKLGVEDTWTCICLRRGQLTQAIEMGKNVLAVKEQLGGYTFLGINSYLAIAAAYGAYGDYRAANGFLDCLPALFEGAELNQALTGRGLYSIARLRWLEGRYDEARLLYQQMVELTPKMPYIWVLQKMLAGLLEMADQHYSKAEILLKEAIQLQSREWVSEVYGSARLLLACLYDRWGKQKEALVELEAVMARCETNHTNGMILQDMPLICSLLRKAAKNGTRAGPAAELLAQVGLSVDEEESGEALLTERQLEILRLIEAGHSNQAIADELVLSLATVKSHVVHIMNRLGASSRMEAVARARASHLL